MDSSDGIFALTPGPVEPRHIKALAEAGPDHAIVIDPDAHVSVIPWTAATALADNCRHLAVWTWREYHGLFAHQDKHGLTDSWAARLAGVANRQFDAIAADDYEIMMWLRFPKPADAPLERLAHAVDASGVREPDDPEELAKARARIAVPSPLEGAHCKGYDLTFGDLDDLYRQLAGTEATDA